MLPLASVELLLMERESEREREAGGRSLRRIQAAGSQSILARSLSQSSAVFHQVFMTGYDSRIPNPAGGAKRTLSFSLSSATARSVTHLSERG